MNYSGEEDGQFHQMVKASDILKHVDLGDALNTAKSKEEYQSLRTKPHGEKSKELIERETKLTDSLKNFTTLPGRYEGNDKGQGDSLQESIRKQGIQRPLHISVDDGRMMLQNGHKRLSSQLAIDPEGEVPVKFVQD